MTSAASLTDEPADSRAWRLFQLLLLSLAAWTANYSRVVLGSLQEAVRSSLSLSDNQIALLQGMGLALPLALGSVPLGLLADRTSRSRMLLFFMALALTSSALSAFASGFASLLAARSLAGIAVAGVLVASYSMAGDLFAPTERGRATAVMAVGESGGPPAAFALGGALLVMMAGAHVLDDWRMALLCMTAVPVPVLLLMLFLREPKRAGTTTRKPPLRTVWPELWSYRGVAIPLQLARATLFIADGAVFVWGAPLFARTYDLSPDRIGALMGLALLAGALLGPALGGPLVDFCERRGGARQAVTIMSGVALLSVVPASLFVFMPEANLTGLMLAIFLVLGFTIAAAALALSLIVIPTELRGLNQGISIVVGSVFFIGLAPLAVSALSSALGGPDMIGKALMMVCVTMSLLNAGILFAGRKYFPGQSSVDSARLVTP